MPNEKGMSEDKKARLEAIRAANAAKKAQAQGNGDAASPPPVAAVSAEPAATPVAVAAPAAAPSRVAAGGNMSDEKKAKLEAIRAANAAKKADAGGSPAAVAPVVAAPAAAAPAPARSAAAPAAPVARPVVRAPAKQQIVEEDRVSGRILMIRMLVGALFGLILCVLLATMTGYYIRGAITGIILGALAGLLVLSWPPQHTTGE